MDLDSYPVKDYYDEILTPQLRARGGFGHLLDTLKQLDYKELANMLATVIRFRSRKNHGASEMQVPLAVRNMIGTVRADTTYPPLCRDRADTVYRPADTLQILLFCRRNGKTQLVIIAAAEYVAPLLRGGAVPVERSIDRDGIDVDYGAQAAGFKQVAQVREQPVRYVDHGARNPAQGHA